MTHALLLLATLALASSAAQRRPDDVRTLPTWQAAHELAKYADCLAERRGSRARAAALAPYLSDEQREEADKLTRAVDDHCLGGFEDVKLTVRSDLLAVTVAEALLEREYPDFQSLVDQAAIDADAERARAAQLTVAERFGRCIVWSNPAGVQALLRTDGETRAEVDAVKALNHDMGMCLAEGSTIRLSRSFVRGIAAVSAYRLAQQLRPVPNGERKLK